MRALLLLFVFGASIVLSTFLAGTGGETGWSAALLKTVSIAGTVLVSVAVFAFAYRVLTVAHVGWRDVLPGAAVAAIARTLLLMLGSWVVDRYIRNASQVYGSFRDRDRTARLDLLGRGQRRRARTTLTPAAGRNAPPLGSEDEEVLASQARQERARPEEQADVRFEERAGEGRDR